MKNYSQLALFHVLFAVVCVGCAGGGGDETTADPNTSTTGEATSTSEASTTSGSTGGETTDAGSEDTGIATTPPETEGGDASSSTSGGEGGSSTTGDEESITVELSYAFLGKVAGVPLDCAAAETMWVDVSVFPAVDPDDTTFDLEDLPCDDAVISVGPLPPGTYSIGVVAWDQNLWDGSSGDFVVDGTIDPLPVTVELTQVPNP